jgi:transposase
MDAVFTHCAGLDVHKKSVTACCLVSDSTGQNPEGVAELRTFGTMTNKLTPCGRTFFLRHVSDASLSSHL